MMTAKNTTKAALSRRALLSGISLLGLGTTSRLRAATGAGSQLPNTRDMRDTLRHLGRMQLSLREEDVPWWYTGWIYAQIGETRPKLLVKFEGTEIYYPRHLDDGTIVLSSRTLSFFRDRTTGTLLETFQNPITRSTNQVRPNKLGGRDVGRYALDGLYIGLEFDPDPEPVPWEIDWVHSGPKVWLTSRRGLENLPQPWLETMTIFADSEEFFDPAVANIQASFSSTYLSPWLSWMDMGDAPGHLVWHAAGRKLTSVDEVPAEYRTRAAAEGARLSAAPDSWD